jgi:hypothetical protein
VIGFGEKAPKTHYPRVLRKVGISPEQYGSWDEDDKARD